MDNSNNSYLDDEQKEKVFKFISDVGTYPNTWNVKEIILQLELKF